VATSTNESLFRDRQGKLERVAAADLQLLLELAEDGLLKELVKTAEEIVAKDDRYEPFTQQIQQLAKQFQTEKIEVLIQKYLTYAEDRG
jgi:hypothetical protein